MPAEQPESYTDEIGNTFWYLPSQGQDYLHRLDGPAIEMANGYTEWRKDNVPHRVGAPAVEHFSGAEYWWVDGQLHRTDGPAVIEADGSTEYYENGQRHRVSGPAVEEASGLKCYWLNGNMLPCEQVEDWIEANNIDLQTQQGQDDFVAQWGV